MSFCTVSNVQLRASSASLACTSARLQDQTGGQLALYKSCSRSAHRSAELGGYRNSAWGFRWSSAPDAAPGGRCQVVHVTAKRKKAERPIRERPKRRPSSKSRGSRLQSDEVIQPVPPFARIHSVDTLRDGGGKMHVRFANRCSLRRALHVARIRTYYWHDRFRFLSLYMFATLSTDMQICLRGLPALLIRLWIHLSTSTIQLMLALDLMTLLWPMRICTQWGGVCGWLILLVMTLHMPRRS